MIQPRAEVLATPRVPHGGSTEMGVLDFSANLNPFGPSPAVLEAVRTAPWDSYPDRNATAVRQILAEQHGISPESVIVGNGSSELIDLVCRAFLHPGDRVAIFGPTYGEYARSARLCGADCEEIVQYPLDSLFPHPVVQTKQPEEQVGLQFQSKLPQLAFLCSPNNPTGHIVPLTEILAFAQNHEDTLVVVDEAYADCVPDFRSVIAAKLDNVVVLRSLTKAHGLAGLRVGYATGPVEIIEALQRVQVPWSVNSIALTAALAALHDLDYTRRTVAEWLCLRNDLVDRLHSLGWQIRVAATPFFLLREAGPTDDSARAWPLRLRRHYMGVRDCASFGLPGVMRICPRLEGDNALLVGTFRQEQEE